MGAVAWQLPKPPAVISLELNAAASSFRRRSPIGASPSEVVALMLGQGLQATALGTLAGLVLAFAASRLLAAYLVGVAPRDPAAFGAAAVAVAAVTAVAAWLPARRAARVDPMTALRTE